MHMLVLSEGNRILSSDYQRRWTMENEKYSPPSETNVASPNSPPSTISVIANFKSPAKSTEIGRDFGAEFASMYRSLFRPKSPIHNPRSVTPSTRSTSAEGEDMNATEHRLQHARLILEHQELTDLYKIYRSRILELNEELEVIRRENDELRLANTELVKILSSQAAFQSFLLSSSSSSPSRSLVDDFRRLSIGGVSPPPDVHGHEEVLDISPTSVIENNRFERPNPERVTLPKSISVRSTVYQKSNPLVASHDGPSRVLPRSRTPSQLAPLTKKVYVRMPGVGSGEKTEEEAALELEVYNQGMTKTELCNKWQETGTCPYGDHCQFAHGITELRPVIRHPRYKTEVCRMILTGDRCPYGHRCHFRHSLTEEERSQLRNGVD